MPEKILPKSSLSKGNCQIVLIAFAVKLFPHPGTPVTSTPFGAGIQYFFAFSDQELLRFKSHFFRLSNPPMSSIPKSVSTYSSIPVFLMTCIFSPKIISMSFFDSLPSLTIARAKAFSASCIVKPNAALQILSLSSSFKFSVSMALLLEISLLSRALISSIFGSGKSYKTISFCRVSGIHNSGDTKITFFLVVPVFNVGIKSLSERTTAVSGRHCLHPPKNT